ncbi:hypothetical protein LOAG_08961 [Loa loa]|uniref:Uncharacterized protein n=1 Tax=Loa loa TaxID=7209 RepID=A0A1S0TUE2_LOALO|nr:hypothetical protein LOAG_08961 [Loa loa]EFO19532.2 hypothetical protein LOAG_08961 [Loa loa]
MIMNVPFIVLTVWETFIRRYRHAHDIFENEFKIFEINHFKLLGIFQLFSIIKIELSCCGGEAGEGVVEEFSTECTLKVNNMPSFGTVTNGNTGTYGSGSAMSAANTFLLNNNSLWLHCIQSTLASQFTVSPRYPFLEWVLQLQRINQQEKLYQQLNQQQEQETLLHQLNQQREQRPRNTHVSGVF